MLSNFNQLNKSCLQSLIDIEKLTFEPLLTNLASQYERQIEVQTM